MPLSGNFPTVRIDLQGMHMSLVQHLDAHSDDLKDALKAAFDQAMKNLPAQIDAFVQAAVTEEVNTRVRRAVFVALHESDAVLQEVIGPAVASALLDLQARLKQQAGGG